MVGNSISAVIKVVASPFITGRYYRHLILGPKETGIINDYELKLKAKNGRVIDASLSSKIVVGKDGKPAGVEGVLRDITERKWAEQELRESQERYKSLTEASPVGIFHSDSQGDFLYVNERWVEINNL